MKAKRPNGWRIFVEAIIGGAAVEFVFFLAWVLAYLAMGR